MADISISSSRRHRWNRPSLPQSWQRSGYGPTRGCFVHCSRAWSQCRWNGNVRTRWKSSCNDAGQRGKNGCSSFSRASHECHHGKNTKGALMVCRGRHFCRALQVYVRLFPFLTWTALPSLGKQHDASRLLASYVHGIVKGNGEVARLF